MTSLPKYKELAKEKVKKLQDDIRKIEEKMRVLSTRNKAIEHELYVLNQMILVKLASLEKEIKKCNCKTYQDYVNVCCEN